MPVFRFLHGVASGDPLSDAIVLWTRVSPVDADHSYPLPCTDAHDGVGAVSVTWRVLVGGDDEGDKDDHDDGDTTTAAVAKSGTVDTSCARDLTVKVDVRGLSPRVRYRYEFSVDSDDGTQTSGRGTFTLPDPPGTGTAAAAAPPLRYAVFSCSNWGWGRFNAYSHAASLEGGLDFWVHLGDFLYEYGAGYPDVHDAVRPVGSLQPDHDLVSLQDYRSRYGLYVSDPQLQQLRAAAPMIAVWDDHEFANDAWVGGAQHHNPATEGSWSARRAAAARAYEEWLPIRVPGVPVDTDTPGYKIERAFRFGDLLSYIVLETRVTARTDPQLSGAPGTNTIDVRGQEYAFTWSDLSKAVGAVLDAYPGANASTAAWTTPMLDEVRAIAAAAQRHADDPTRAIVGTTQLAWLTRTLQEHGGGGGGSGSGSASDSSGGGAGSTRFQVVGLGQVVSPLRQPELLAGSPDVDLDDWATAGTDKDAGTALAAQAQAVLHNACTAPLAEGPTNVVTTRMHKYARNFGKPVPVTAWGRRQALISGAAAKCRVPLNFDGWNGYKAERRRLLAALQSSGAPRVVLNGGDSHNAWAGDLFMEDEGNNEEGGSPVAVEFAGMAVSSPGLENHMPTLPSGLVAGAYVEANAETGLRFADTENKGYMVFEVTADRFHGEYVAVDVSNGDSWKERVQCLWAADYDGGRLRTSACRIVGGTAAGGGGGKEKGREGESGGGGAGPVVLAVGVVLCLALLAGVWWWFRARGGAGGGGSRGRRHKGARGEAARGASAFQQIIVEGEDDEGRGVVMGTVVSPSPPGGSLGGDGLMEMTTFR